MAIEIKMPQLGITMTEGTITKWLKKEGDYIKKGEPLFEIETDKYNSEIESDAEGVLLKILKPQWSDVPVQGIIALIGEAGEEVSDNKQLEISNSEKKTEEKIVIQENNKKSQKNIKASPLAKKMAAELEIDLANIIGTGPSGRIVQEDIIKAKEQQKSSVKEIEIEKIETIISKENGNINQQESSNNVRRKRMNSMRRAISKNMSNSWLTAPMVTYYLSADTTKLTELKTTFQKSGHKFSYTDLLAKLVSKALLEFPYLNASVDGDDVVYHDFVNMGVAVALDEGLVVPVIKNVEQKGLIEISSEVKLLVEKATRGNLSPDNMNGGTFTITNLGSYNIEGFTPIINQPESAILGVGSIINNAVEVNGEIVMKPLIKLSLTADHRIVDGAVAAKFLNRILTLIENPWEMFL